MLMTSRSQQVEATVAGLKESGTEGRHQPDIAQHSAPVRLTHESTQSPGLANDEPNDELTSKRMEDGRIVRVYCMVPIRNADVTDWGRATEMNSGVTERWIRGRRGVHRGKTVGHRAASQLASSHGTSMPKAHAEPAPEVLAACRAAHLAGASVADALGAGHQHAVDGVDVGLAHLDVGLGHLQEA